MKLKCLRWVSITLFGYFLWRATRYEAAEAFETSSQADSISHVSSSKKHVKYLVMVVSNPANRLPRDLIRRYGYWTHNWTDVDGNLLDWKHYFVVGQNADPAVNEAINQEGEENKDILIGSFEDSYRNLVYKTI